MTENSHNRLLREFDKFWRSLPTDHQRSINRTIARQAFVAGSQIIVDVPRPYRFQSGKWRVTVKATSMAAAKAEAKKKLTQRSEKLDVKPPSAGWILTPVGEELL